MAKEHKNAWLYILILAVLSLGGAAAGVWKTIPAVVVSCALPVALYEAYRTEGIFTKIASVLTVAVLIAELVVLAAKINIGASKIAAEAGREAGKYVRALERAPGSREIIDKVSLIDANLAGPAVILLLSLYLLKSTGGIYTRILALLITVSSVALALSIKPELLKIVTG